MSRDGEPIDLGARGLHGLMVFSTPRPWTKVAHPVSADKDLEAQEASVERQFCSGSAYLVFAA